MATVLKRKRSDSEISTTSSLLSSPLSNSFMTIDSFQSQQQIQTPSLFSSRTRKRHRDNRPSESDVHQHTLSLLFSAQNNTHTRPLALFEEAQQTQETPIASIPTNTESGGGHQSSLHSFFNISAARQSSPSNSSTTSNSTANMPTYTAAMSSLFPATNCEDCSASLGQAGVANAMDVDMMDVDVANGANYGCEQCGKAVCHGCAVSNLGEQRRCLNCAGRREKQWVGGLGWV